MIMSWRPQAINFRTSSPLMMSVFLLTASRPDVFSAESFELAIEGFADSVTDEVPTTLSGGRGN